MRGRKLYYGALILSCLIALVACHRADSPGPYFGPTAISGRSSPPGRDVFFNSPAVRIVRRQASQ